MQTVRIYHWTVSFNMEMLLLYLPFSHKNNYFVKRHWKKKKAFLYRCKRENGLPAFSPFLTMFYTFPTWNFKILVAYTLSSANALIWTRLKPL